MAGVPLALDEKPKALGLLAATSRFFGLAPVVPPWLSFSNAGGWRMYDNRSDKETTRMGGNAKADSLETA
jgi:hypothetical protein